MGNYVLSFQRNDNEPQSYIFDSYLLAFEYFAELLKQEDSRYVIRQGAYGKGIYWSNDCVFAYGDDLGKDLENFTEFAILTEDEYYEESDGFDDEEEEEEDEENEEFDEDADEDDENGTNNDNEYPYDNDTRI